MTPDPWCLPCALTRGLGLSCYWGERKHGNYTRRLNIQDQVVLLEPVHEPLHLLSVGQVIVPNETHHCCIMCILYDGLRQQSCKQSKLQWTHNASLWESGARDGAWDGVSHFQWLWSIGEEIQQPVAHGHADCQWAKFANQLPFYPSGMPSSGKGKDQRRWYPLWYSLADMQTNTKHYVLYR